MVSRAQVTQVVNERTQRSRWV